MFKVSRQERVSECVVVPQNSGGARIVEQITAVPQIQEHAAGVFKVTPTLGLDCSFVFLEMMRS